MRSNLISLPFSDGLTPTSYELPEKLSADQWLEVGRALGKADRSLMWWIGDWWAYGEHEYGDRAAIVKSDDWEGPKFQTCMDAAWVCRRFETSSRDEVVSFRKHRAIASIDNEQMRLDVLKWTAENDATIKEIEAKVKEVRAFLSQGWTPDQLERKAQAEAGACVVANIRETNGRRTDEALLAWAEANDRFVRIDRKTEWGNPFEIPEDGDRDAVVDKFNQFYFPHKDGLRNKATSLRGKVLGCWCHPEKCHGHVIAEFVNASAAPLAEAAE